MDELGSALRHSDNANFRVSPFLFMPEGNLTSAIRYIHKIDILFALCICSCWKLLFCTAIWNLGISVPVLIWF